MVKKSSTTKAAAKKTTVKKLTVKKPLAKKMAVKKVISKKAKVVNGKKTTAKKEIAVKPKKIEKKVIVKVSKTKKTEKVIVKKKVEKVKPVKKQKKVQEIIEEKKPVHKAVKGYSKKDLDHFRKVILDKQKEIREQLQNLQEQMKDPTTGEYINENSPYSLHMAEQGTDAMEREKTFLYYQRENKFLSYLDDALKRVDAGTYGLCLECIEEPKHLCPTCPLIPKARLEAVPHSQQCVQIKMLQEKKIKNQ
ncbi:MAG: conjugal transfer protein TraR [Ignavibacteriaceae bacterium]|jgi:RNA polymerase-binding transcription factor DksA|nr:conjugal transfer protein TraR [Ignavibacteriaceae bacterium]